MKLYAFPPSTRSLAIMALLNHLELDCDLIPVDLSRGDQLSADYKALNPNHKVPTLEDDGFALWEGNAILFYLASKAPHSGLWPADLREQANALRWLAWQSAHWDAESCGMVSFEKASKMVLGLGPADPAFVTRGEQNFVRFAGVLSQSLEGRRWLLGEQLTIADFSIGAFVPSAKNFGLPITDFPEILRWYADLSQLPAWQAALAVKADATAAWVASRTH